MKLYLPILFFLLLHIITSQRSYVITSTPIQINLEAFQMEINGQWVRIDIGVQGGSQPYQFFYDQYPEGWKHIESSVYIPKNCLYFSQKYPLRIRVLDQLGNQARASIVFLISQGNIAISPIIYPYQKKFDDTFFNEGSFRNKPNLIRSQSYYSQLYSQYSSYPQTFNPYQSFDNGEDINSFFERGMKKSSFSSPLFQNRQINKGVINNYINYNIGNPIQTTNNLGNPILRNTNQQFRTYNNPIQSIQPIQPMQTMKPIQSINLGTINIKNPNPQMINLGSLNNAGYIQSDNNFNKNTQQFGSINLMRSPGQQISSIGAIQIGNSQPASTNNKGTFTILNPKPQTLTNNIFQTLFNQNSNQKVIPKNVGQFQIKTVDTGTDATQMSSNKNNPSTDNKNIPVNIITPNRNFNGINKALNNINGWQLVPSSKLDQNGLPSSWQLIKPGYSNCYQLVPVSQMNGNGGSFYKLLPIQSTEPELINTPQYYSLNQNGIIYRFQYPNEPRPYSQDDLNFPYWQIVPQKINPNGVPSAFSLVGSYQNTPLVPYLYGQPSYSVINIDNSSPKSNTIANNQSDTNSEVIIQIGRNITIDPNNTNAKKPQPLPNPNLNPTIRNNTSKTNITTPTSPLTNPTSESPSTQTNSPTSSANSNKNSTTANNLTPSNPTNPTNPISPTNPTSPTNNPTTNPTSPTNPANPTNPVNPTNPANPTNPTSTGTGTSLANSTNPITKDNLTNPAAGAISTSKTDPSGIYNSTNTGTSIKNSTTDTLVKNNPSSSLPVPTTAPNQNITSAQPPISPTIPLIPVTPIIVPIPDTNYSGLANNQQIDDLIVNLDSLALNKIIDDVYNFDNLTCQQKSSYLLNMLGRMQVAIKDKTYMAAMLATQISQAKKAYDNYIFQINQTRQEQIQLNTQQQKQRIEVVLKTIQGVSSQLNDQATTIPPLSTEIDNLKKNISMENSKSEIDRKQMVNQKLLYNQADIAVKNFLNQLNLANAEKNNILKTINKLNTTITDSEAKIKSNTDSIFNLGNQILELSFIVDTEKYNYGNLQAEVQKYREQIARATRKQSQILPEITNLQEKLRIEKGKSATDQLDRIKEMIKQLQKSLPNLQKFVDENYYRCNNASNLTTNQNGSQIIYIVGVTDFQKYIQSSYQVQPNWSKISLPTESIRLNHISILDPTWQGAFGSPYDSVSFINTKDFSFKNDFNCLNPSTLQSGQAEIASVGNRFIMVTDSEGMIRLNLGTCTRIQSTLYLPSIGQKIYWRGSPVTGNNQYNIYRATCI